MADESVKGGTDGVPIAVDLVDGANVQRVKLDVGGDGLSVPVVGTLPVSGTVTVANPTPPLATQPVSGTVAVSNLPATQPVSAAALPLPAGAATEATLTAASAKLPATLGQKAMAASLSVALATDQATGATTATRSSVNADVADTALLAADAARLGATIYNESTATCYVGYGTTAASLTSYSVQVPAGGYLEVPAQFVRCAIRGYWAAANGAARVTAG